MKTETSLLSIPSEESEYFPDHTCILDLETQGKFSRKGRLAMIFLISHISGGIQLTTWEAEGSGDEYAILLALSKALEEQRCIVTYNGTSFDLPVLRDKYAAHALPSPLDGKMYRDLYLDDKYLVSLFGLPSRKLKDFALLFPSFSASGLKSDAELTLHLLSLDSVRQIFEKKWSLISAARDEDHLYYGLSARHIFPFRLSISDGIYHVILDRETIRLSVKIIENHIRRYYTDVTNYVYLPREGYSIHKSIAGLVEKKHKEKAVRENCFSLILVSDRFLTDDKTINRYLDSVFAYLRTR